MSPWDTVPAAGWDQVSSSSQSARFPPTKFSGASRLKPLWTKAVLDDNLGCRPLKSLYTLFQICKCSFGYGSWSSFHEHPHSSAEKRVKSVIYQTHAEIAWFQFPCLPFLYAWNCLYHLCLCTIYIKMFFLSPVTNSVWVNIKTIPLTSKRAKRMQEKSEEKTMSIFSIQEAEKSQHICCFFFFYVKKFSVCSSVLIKWAKKYLI